MKKILFLDRDGVINRERGDYTWRKEDFTFLPDLFETLRWFQKQNFEIIVITNQGGIAKGLYSLEDFRLLDRWMHEGMKKEGVRVLKTYFSPDHDDFSKSLSRKPASMMFERAIDQFHVDVKQSIMIGDSPRDIEAAAKVGIRGVLVSANTSWKILKSIILDER